MIKKPIPSSGSIYAPSDRQYSLQNALKNIRMIGMKVLLVYLLITKESTIVVTNKKQGYNWSWHAYCRVVCAFSQQIWMKEGDWHQRFYG